LESTCAQKRVVSLDFTGIIDSSALKNPFREVSLS
jgi:hypothetical protein